MIRLDESVDQWGMPSLEEASSNIRIWRSVNDLDPAAADPYFKGDGVLGVGTYFRPEQYAPVTSYSKRETTWAGDQFGDPVYDPKNWKLFTEYDASFKNIAHLNDENTEQLWNDEYIGKEGNPLKVGRFDSYDVGRLAKRKGFDAVLVTGEDVDGGNQVFIMAGSKPVIRTVSHLIIFRKKSVAQALAKEIGIKASGSVVKFAPSETRIVSAFLKSIKESSSVDQWGMPLTSKPEWPLEDNLAEEVIGIEVPYNKEVPYAEVYAHPTRSQVIFCLKGGDCRAYLDGDRLIVWPPFDAIHFTVRENLKLGSDAIPLYLYGHGGKVVSVVVTDDSKKTNWHHSPEVADVILNHPELKRFFADDNVDVGYYDEAIVGDWRNISESLEEASEERHSITLLGHLGESQVGSGPQFEQKIESEIPKKVIEFFESWNEYEWNHAENLLKDEELKKWMSKFPRWDQTLYRGLHVHPEMMAKWKSKGYGTEEGERFKYKELRHSSWSTDPKKAEQFIWTGEDGEIGLVLEGKLSKSDILLRIGALPERVIEKIDEESHANLQRMVDEQEVIARPGSYDVKIVYSCKKTDVGGFCAEDFDYEFTNWIGKKKQMGESPLSVTPTMKRWIWNQGAAATYKINPFDFEGPGLSYIVFDPAQIEIQEVEELSVGGVAEQVDRWGIPLNEMKLKPIQWVMPTESEIEQEFHEGEIYNLLIGAGYPSKEEEAEAFDFFKSNLERAEIDPKDLDASNAWRFRFKDYSSMRKTVTSYGGPKDPDSMVKKIQSGGSLPMPVVLRKADGKMLLAGGATRTAIAGLADQKIQALVFDEKKALGRQIKKYKDKVQAYIERSADIQQIADRVESESKKPGWELSGPWLKEIEAKFGKKAGFEAYNLGCYWGIIRRMEKQIS